jgi:hypothetical protein
MAWGCFSWMGLGALEFLEEGKMMNVSCYRKIMDEKLELFTHQHGTSHILQDSALCNKARIVMKWFSEQPNITLIKWLGHSPDLNPIENVWSWMKMKFKQSSAKNIVERKREITELWTLRMGEINYLPKLLGSMPRSLAEVTKKDGWTTHY